MAATQPADDKVRGALSRPMTVVDISTTGRKSGQERRIEIVMHNIDGRLYISGQPSRTRRSWLANLGADPKLTLHVKRGAHADLPAAAREITDPKERRQILEHVARNWKRPDVDTMVEYSPLIEVTINGAPAASESRA
ncbi:MAG: nitroreductase/quinone reductase family protein [Candidatus Dormibacteraeota bacterium]|nr:nitroreductase/quinone reductase family protein [Candidatus Dormibacteraeota bacterium]